MGNEHIDAIRSVWPEFIFDFIARICSGSAIILLSVDVDFAIYGKLTTFQCLICAIAAYLVGFLADKSSSAIEDVIRDLLSKIPIGGNAPTFREEGLAKIDSLSGPHRSLAVKLLAEIVLLRILTFYSFGNFLLSLIGSADDGKNRFYLFSLIPIRLFPPADCIVVFLILIIAWLVTLWVHSRRTHSLPISRQHSRGKKRDRRLKKVFAKSL